MPMSKKTAVLARALIKEETSELRHALSQGNLALIADGCVDSIYVILWAANVCGINLAPIWEAVHLSNMKKTGGGKRADGKVLKPKGWVPPDVLGLIRDQQEAYHLRGVLSLG